MRSLSPNQKKTLTCTAIANGGKAEWDFAYEIYLKSEVVNEKQALLSAMGCSKDAAILSKFVVHFTLFILIGNLKLNKLKIILNWCQECWR